MIKNKLKINDSKTEFIIFRSPLLKQNLSDLSVSVGDIQVSPSSKVRDLLLLLFAIIRSVVKSFKVPDVEVAAARMSNESALTHDLLDTKKTLVRLDAGPGWMS